MKKATPGALLLLPLVLGGCSPKSPTTPITSPSVSGTASSPVHFVEAAEKSGIKYAWSAPGKRPLNILQTIGNGCAFLDFNNDGNLDILLVGPKPALFQGDGKGSFTDVSTSVLGALSGYFLGCAVGDYDNDGFQDLYLSGYREGRLLHNEGGKSFKDATPASGLKPQPWGTSASWADLDRDGKLDLYIANYAIFDKNTKPQLCDFNGILSSCGPRFYDPERGVLYHNTGGGKFVGVTERVGAKKVAGRGLGVACLDFNESGFDSIAIANDELPGDLLLNKNFTFTNEGTTSGTAYDSEGRAHGGMGIDWGDYDNDGKPDLVVATFSNEVKALYHNEGGGFFQEKAASSGLAGTVEPYITFGIKFFDANNDGFLDLILANGHVQGNIAQIEKAESYRQPVVFLQNNQGRVFEDKNASSGIGTLKPIVGRGLAVGDYDNDGKMDVLVVDSEGKPLLLHNETPQAGHWLLLRLDPGKGIAHGALLTITLPDGTKLLRHCQTDGSYMSASDPRVHVGLGSATKASVTVKWPSGKTTDHKDLAADQAHTLAL